MKTLLYIYILTLCATIISACASKSPAETGNGETTDTSLQEIESCVGREEWETARIKAENVYAAERGRLSPLQAAKLTTVYISLTSEPGIGFEQFYNYALRIVELHDYAMAKDSSLVSNYFEIVGGGKMIQEAYDNCKYIISTKKEIGNDSTIIFN